MQRPTMNPVFRAEDVQVPKKKTPRWKTAFKNTVVRFFKWIVKFFFTSPVTMGRRAEVENRPPFVTRFIRGLAYRALFLPILVALSTSTLVFTGTHPRVAFSATDPATFGVYYDPVSFNSPDGTRCEGWIAPVVDAHSVLERKEKLLRIKHPAVVLVHDFAKGPQQVLPLFSPLHEDGIVVIAVGLRGTHASTLQTAGQTFGLKEAMDVQGAVDALRQYPFVDGNRIAVLGIGSGASAAVLAASKDSGIKATVLIDPLRDPEEVIRRHIVPDRKGLQWMQPLCKWTFELAYRVDAEEMDVTRFPEVTKVRPSLLLDSKGDPEFVAKADTIKQVRDFLGGKLRVDKELTLPPAKGGKSGTTGSASAR